MMTFCYGWQSVTKITAPPPSQEKNVLFVKVPHLSSLVFGQITVKYKTSTNMKTFCQWHVFVMTITQWTSNWHHLCIPLIWPNRARQPNWRTLALAEVACNSASLHFLSLLQRDINQINHTELQSKIQTSTSSCIFSIPCIPSDIKLHFFRAVHCFHQALWCHRWCSPVPGLVILQTAFAPILGHVQCISKIAHVLQRILKYLLICHG